jgi:hypothetical protein
VRTLLAIIILAVGIFALSAPSDAARKAKRIAKPHQSEQRYAKQPRYSREDLECERARSEDPGGTYAGFPCWAREGFSRGPSISQ